MKKRMYRMRQCGIVLSFLLVFTMLFGMVSQVRAEDKDAGQIQDVYNPDAKGSIKVELPDLEGVTSKEDVQVNLYKVGELDTSNGYFFFSLSEKFEKMEDVDLNNISTAEDNGKTAQKLVQAVEANKIEVLKSEWTDAQGEAVFSGLEQGMYLVSQGNTNAYGTFNAFVMPVPYANETGWIYDITIQPKAYPVMTMGRIEVTKKIKGIHNGNLQDVHANNDTYYIGLFLDADGTIPYRGEHSVKPVHIIDGNSGTISFDNIPVSSQPYYVFETTEDGKPIKYMMKQPGENGFYCMAGEVLGAEGHDTAPVIIMEEQADGIGSAVISNVYSDLPDGHYYTGEITITKSVKDGGNIVTTNDVFYAGIFAVDAQGNVSENPVEIVKLNSNGSVKVKVPLGGINGTESITYAVKETNEKGVPVKNDSGFLYTVTGEGNVTLSLDQLTGAIHLTNTLGLPDNYYQESTTEESTSTNPADDTQSSENNHSSGNTSSGRNTGSGSSRTGDTNQIMLYAGLLAAAAAGVIVIRRKNKKIKNN